jgi:hypothetical protein
VSESDVDLSNWAGNLTGRFIKVLTQREFHLRPTHMDEYGAVQTHIRTAHGTDAETAVREPRRSNLID